MVSTIRGETLSSCKWAACLLKRDFPGTGSFLFEATLGLVGLELTEDRSQSSLSTIDSQIDGTLSLSRTDGTGSLPKVLSVVLSGGNSSICDDGLTTL